MMYGYQFAAYQEALKAGSVFDQLLELFKELLVHTSGDAAEALSWLTELDRQYRISTSGYGMGDFIEDLKKNGYLQENNKTGMFQITPKTEASIRRQSLEHIFGKMKKGRRGGHKSTFSGQGDEINPERRPYQFGDTLEQIAMSDSLRNAQIRHGMERFYLEEGDLEVQENDFKTQSSVVLMIDISHSMILYGEDRITPAKQVAMALAEYMRLTYPKDTLDILVFGNDAWQIEVKDLPYLQVGPYHTNTVAGLELAINLLQRRKNPNKHIFMITDGKPTCLKEGNRYYKNSFGLDSKILNKCYTLAAHCRKLRIPVTTFMIAQDSYLQEFVQEFTEINQGKAFYSDLQGLGSYIFEDYSRNKRRRVR